MPDRTPKKRPGRPQKKGQPAWVPRFLLALRESCNVRLSCEVGKVARTTVYQRRDKDAAFRAKWDEAIEDGIEVMEAEARRRGLVGVEDPVFYLGQKIGVVQKYSDVLLMFLLKAHRPEVYRERYEVQTKGSAMITFVPDMGGPVLNLAAEED